MKVTSKDRVCRIYANLALNDNAMIIGNPAALKALAESIERLLDHPSDYKGARAECRLEMFSRDGERYDLIVRRDLLAALPSHEEEIEDMKRRSKKGARKMSCGIPREYKKEIEA